MPLFDDDPVTPDAVNGVFTDAKALGRPARVFTITVSGAARPHAIDHATVVAVETLNARKDISACAGSITVLMSGGTAGVVIAQPQGAPTLKSLGASLVESLAAEFTASGVQVCIGMATTLDHKELDVDEAIAVAMEGLEVATASGSSRAVHSELYELTLATHRRKGTVFPLEAVELLDDDARSPSPVPAVEASAASTEVPSESADTSAAEVLAAEAPPEAPAGMLGEIDDPFAHLASEAYELGADSASALTNGIAPRAEAVAKIEQQSRAEIERLRLELELARREKSESTAKGSAIKKQERRISKLVKQLEGAEVEITRLRDERQGDSGVASQFKAVQGLDPNGATAPVKRAIIDGMFESNRPATPDAKGR